MQAINPQDLDTKQNYKLLTGCILPRAIAWVSSQAEDGTLNLAPFSYFTAVTANPPTILFCPGTRGADGHDKDTYHNVKATGEFVVNFVSEAVAQAMVTTAVEAPPDVDEFQRANLTPIASEVISVPRVKESPIHFECKLNQIVSIGDGHIVIGEVVYMHFADGIRDANNYINLQQYQPVGRLAGSGYTRVTDLFDLQRPPSEVQPKAD